MYEWLLLTMFERLPGPYHKTNTNGPSQRDHRDLERKLFENVSYRRSGVCGLPGGLLIHDVALPPRLEAELHWCPQDRMVSALRPFDSRRLG
jgi:hypothetical protein